MQPLHELLHRIKWDADFGRGTFEVGYYDRLERREIVVPLASIRLDPGAFSFSVGDPDGRAVQIPLHRVRTVYKDGVAIWRRAGREPPDSG